MQRIFFSILLLLFLFNPFLINADDHDKKDHGNAVKFIENKNQWEKQVLFKADVQGGALFLEKNSFTYTFFDVGAMNKLLGHGHNNESLPAQNNKVGFHAFKVKFQNANPDPQVRGSSKTTAYSNYFIGNDRSRWASYAYSFEGVIYNGLYDNIDMKLYTSENYLKYDFIVKSGGKPGDIALAYDGVDNIYINRGHLVIKTSVNEIMEQKPYAYQVINGIKKEVICNFVLKDKQVNFDFPQGYDLSKELIIDPTLIFSTYSGSLADNFGYTATFDSKGFLYSGSSAFGAGYPTTTGAYDQVFNGGTVDIAITKYDTTGQSLIYSTYIGGSSVELPHSLIVNSVDEVFIYGTTSSLNYHTTTNAFDTTFNGGTPLPLGGLGVNYNNGSDIIISRLSANGANLLASTFIGGTANDGLNSTPGNQLKYNYADEVRGEIMIDVNNNIYVASCTRSINFPVTANVFQPVNGGGTLDGCIVKLDNNLTTLIWGSYLGGNDDDAIFSVELDNIDNLYVTGGTRSPDFPTTTGVLYPTFMGGRCDGFVTHIVKNGQNIINSTYFGSANYDQSYFVESDKQNNVYIFGQTQAPGATFIQNALYNSPNSGQFITKMSPTLDAVVWSTRFGTGSGVPNISPTAFLVDVCNKIYLSGWGGTTNGFGGTNGMNTTANAYQSTTDNSDFYLMVMEDDASALFYGTFFGSPNSSEHVDGGTSRFDRKGRVYQSVCAGCGGDDNFPTTPGAWSSTNNSTNCNNGVFKLDFNIPITIADFDPPPVNCATDSITFNNTSIGDSTTTFLWNFGDGNSSTQFNPTHLYTQAGTFAVTLISYDSTSCNLSDTITKQVTILADTTYSLDPYYICNNGNQQIGLLPSPGQGITYTWSPATGLTETDIPNPIASPDTTTTYRLVISNGVCADTLFQTVYVDSFSMTVSNDTSLCGNANLNLWATTNGIGHSYIWSSNSNYTDTLNASTSDSTLFVNPATSATYYIKSISQNCIITDSVVVTVLSVSITTQNAGICNGDTITIQAVNLNSSDPVTYSWTPTANIISGANTSSPLINPTTNITYTVTATNALGCQTTNTVTVNVSGLTFSSINAYADEDTIGSGASTLIHALPGQGYNYTWLPAASLSNASIADPTATPLITTTYTFTISDNGCSYQDSVTVYVFEMACEEPNIFIPSAFTPNDDKHNDIIFVRGKFIDELYFVIYNRWGEKVFETLDQSIGWDGTYKEMKADPGVFVYYLTATCIDQQKFFKKGNLTLIR